MCVWGVECGGGASETLQTHYVVLGGVMGDEGVNTPKSALGPLLALTLLKSQLSTCASGAIDFT